MGRGEREREKEKKLAIHSLKKGGAYFRQSKKKRAALSFPITEVEKHSPYTKKSRKQRGLHSGYTQKI